MEKSTPKYYNEQVKRNQMKYNKAHLRQVKFALNIGTDADIIAWLDSVENKQGYLKALIRADIARAKSETTMKEDETMTYNPISTTFSPTFDHDPGALHIRNASAQNPDDPGIPAGTGARWYAVVQNQADDWSNGSEDLAEALRLAQNIPGAKVLKIDNSLDNPFITDEIDPREKTAICTINHSTENGTRLTISYDPARKAIFSDAPGEEDIPIAENLDSIEAAEDAVQALYSSTGWDLQWIERDE